MYNAVLVLYSAQLWIDLALMARREELWDVCRLACRFALAYDDGRWHLPEAPAPPGSAVTTKRGKRGGAALSQKAVSLHAEAPEQPAPADGQLGAPQSQGVHRNNRDYSLLYEATENASLRALNMLLMSTLYSIPFTLSTRQTSSFTLGNFKLLVL